ncbi:MAG TPA: hypothetical protein VHO06_25985 [Polyangia bacterium]|nr:hypothetical protein [Polyangia bacterium]
MAVLSATSGGCSFLFVHGPPPEHRTSSFFDCTSGNVLPILDAVVGGAAVVDAIGVASDAAAFSSSPSARRADLVTYGAAAALFVTSAAYGFKKTSACREAKVELARRLPPPALALPPPVPPDPWIAPAPPPPAPSPGAAPPPAPAAPPGGASPWEAAPAD